MHVISGTWCHNYTQQKKDFFLWSQRLCVIAITSVKQKTMLSIFCHRNDNLECKIPSETDSSVIWNGWKGRRRASPSTTRVPESMVPPPAAPSRGPSPWSVCLGVYEGLHLIQGALVGSSGRITDQCPWILLWPNKQGRGLFSSITRSHYHNASEF